MAKFMTWQYFFAALADGCELNPMTPFFKEGFSKLHLFSS